jgi:RHH-type proline utilization regulon transcriptional repressor/proline dehydrogenase/delta 1-pyrroline-5-carboxylate dehydrogenase
VLCITSDPQRLKMQHDLVRATGNRVAADESDKDIAAVLFASSPEDLTALNRRLAERPGRIVPVHLEPYPREFLFDEVSLSVNTAAAGGNASLMAIG